MEPASTIIAKLGGPTKVAQIVGVHRVRVSNWKQPRTRGGTGGTIPQRHIPALIAHARAAGIALGGDDFLPQPDPPPDITAPASVAGAAGARNVTPEGDVT